MQNGFHDTHALLLDSGHIFQFSELITTHGALRNFYFLPQLQKSRTSTKNSWAVTTRK